MSGLLLAIDAYFDRFDSTGAATGFMDPINIPKLTLTQPDPDKIERISYMRSTKGQALDAYLSPKPIEIEFDTDECAPDILSMALLGTPAAYSQAAGTDQTISFHCIEGKWVAIGKNSLTAFSITGKTAGTDYLIDMEAGLFKSLTIPTGEVTATASYEGRSGSTIVAGTDTLLQIGLRGAGVNLFTGKQIDIEVYKAIISPTGGLNFITSDPMTLSFKGTLVTPPGKPGPYQITEHAKAT